ncbi:glycosyltransferase [Plastoroseomonas arctica]|uniref:Glycosyltransferase n=1 Tax=Plastoroseomonas arctica TaxID=1509237 RepID=A0AAF1JXL4_9PROT|nr:glycosyltransferase [Plastoroseomonas arctica]MBR0656239.1 glycosyltransferase [Plastoroseomonas arctica]
MRPIGYYVHHHGAGHWQRAAALAARLRHPCVLLGTAPGVASCPVVELPDDAGGHGTAPGLHYAPIDHAGLRARTARIAGWIAEVRPALMVVDVSVEVAMLARLCSTPVLYVRLAGKRDDPPHLAAFGAARALLAPYPAAIEATDTPSWVRHRTFHAGFLTASSARSRPGKHIAVVFGRGGSGGDREALIAAASAVPERQWNVLGPVSPGASRLPDNLALLGWRDDVVEILAGAAVVVGGGGDGLLAEVAALGKRFICLPEPRPFDEQVAKAERLAELGAAICRTSWPQADSWPALLDEAFALDPTRIAALHDPQALTRAAAFIDDAAQA